jgi:hypothetical protein
MSQVRGIFLHILNAGTAIEETSEMFLSKENYN